MNTIRLGTFAPEEVNKIFDRYINRYLGIQAVEIRENALVATMPITDKVRQPFGILQGGVSVVLAESVGLSIGVLHPCYPINAKAIIR